MNNPLRFIDPFGRQDTTVVGVDTPLPIKPVVTIYKKPGWLTRIRNKVRSAFVKAGNKADESLDLGYSYKIKGGVHGYSELGNTSGEETTTSENADEMWEMGSIIEAFGAKGKEQKYGAPKNYVEKLKSNLEMKEKADNAGKQITKISSDAQIKKSSTGNGVETTNTGMPVRRITKSGKNPSFPSPPNVSANDLENIPDSMGLHPTYDNAVIYYYRDSTVVYNND